MWRQGGGVLLRGMTKRASAWILVAVSLAAVSLVNFAGALNSTPRTFVAADSGDTFLSSLAPSSPHGTASVLWVSGGRYVNWTLVQFDLSGRLRPGDLVVRARIGLVVSDAKAASFPLVLTTGRALTAWAENKTTFRTAPLFSFDTSTATSVGSNQGVPRGTTVWIDVSKQLKRWHSYGGPSNFGTVIMMGPNEAGATVGFASRENMELGKPVLEVTFQPGPRSVYPYLLGPAPGGTVVARPER